MESVKPAKRIDAKHTQLVWEVRNAANQFDQNRAATNVDLELTRQRNLIRKMAAKIVLQRERIENQEELLDEAGVYDPDSEEDEDNG